LIIDDLGLLLSRYREYLSGKEQPGVGDAFLKYLADNEYNKRKVTRISLTSDSKHNFEAFPKIAELETFDHADRIFVALALSASVPSVIINAVDSDYSHHREALEASGVRVEELCPERLKPR
jgi:hypothetical protein